MKGKFIVIEGIDGCGKTTQIDELSKWLPSSGLINKIKQNLTWAFGYNLLAIPLAAGILFPKYGILLTPSIAALLMAISSITVVINALSLD